MLIAKTKKACIDFFYNTVLHKNKIARLKNKKPKQAKH